MLYYVSIKWSAILKFVELKPSLSKRIEPIYFVQGEDGELRSRAIELIKKKCLSAMVDINLQIYNDENFNFQQFLESCQTLPFGSDHRVIILRGVSINLSEKNRDALQNYFDNPVATTVVIFTFSEKNDLYTKYSSQACVVECDYLPSEILAKIVAKIALENSKTITKAATQLLIEYCKNDLSSVENETKKLMFAVDGSQIEEQDISLNVHKSVDYAIYELTNAISEKDADKALAILNRLFSENNTTQLTLSLLGNFARRSFYSSVSYLDNAGISKLLDVKEFAIKMLKQKNKTFKKVHLKNLLQNTLYCDYKIKAGKLTDKNAIYSFVLDAIQSA